MGRSATAKEEKKMYIYLINNALRWRDVVYIQKFVRPKLYFY